MRWAGTNYQSPKQCLRKSPRTGEFSAGLLARDDRSEPLNCLIRDVSPDGAQIRVNAAVPVPAQGYMINLKTRSAHHVHAVWRQGSLTGLGLGDAYAIDDSLPRHLEFLGSLFIEAKLRQADQMVSEGTGRAEALRKCGIAAELYRRSRDILSV